MPSPCEVPPNQPEQLTIAQITMDGERPRGRTVHRVIPAMAGGMFAGLLLIGLGCTPFFQPRGAQASGENAVIVKAGAATKENGQVVVGGDEVVTRDSAHAAARAAAADGAGLVVGGTPTIASSSSSKGGITATGHGSTATNSTECETHRFAINCEPLHAGEDKITLRPETVALQGILASSASKAALLDGVLYREGDSFGAKQCPWTVADINAASVRIEKTIGDRVCGVTIHMSTSEKPQAASSSPKATSSRATAARSR